MKRKTGPLDRQSPTPAESEEDGSAFLSGISSLLSAWSLIARQLRIAYYSLQAGTDGPVLLGHTGSTGSASALRPAGPRWVGGRGTVNYE